MVRNAHRVKPKGFYFNDDIASYFPFEDVHNSSVYGPPSFELEDEIKAFKRYETIVSNYNPVSLKKVQAWATIIFGHFMVSDFPSHEDVVNNFNKKASPGFPYNLDYTTKGELLEMCGDLWLMDAFESWKSKPYQGTWKQFLKEEIRLKGKDTRGIVSCPIDIEYFMQRFFLLQNKGFYSAYLQTPSMVGISRDKLEWEKLFRYLNKFNEGFTSDVSKFDSKMLEVLMFCVRDIRKTLLKSDQKWAEPFIDYCYDYACFSVVLIDNMLIQKEGGNPSGWPNTTVDNTIVNFILMAYAYLELNPSHALNDFMTHVRLALYGDDNKNTFDQEKCVYHPDLVAQVLNTDFGYVVKHDGLQDVLKGDFLSASFTPVEFSGHTIHVPVFDKTRMLSHIFFTKIGSSLLREFLRLASLRAINCFVPEIYIPLENWLYANHFVIDKSLFSSYVPPIEYWQRFYYFPGFKDKEFVGNFNSPLCFDITGECHAKECTHETF